MTAATLRDARRGRPWRPAPALKLSIAFHVAALAMLVVVPTAWPWIVGALLVNHALLTSAGLWPRSTLLGPNLTRLPDAAVARREIALTFDDGPDPAVTPRVLDLLDRHGAKASFFCIGERATQHPELVREIVRRGHSVENHSQRHAITFSFSGVSAFRREIEAAQTALADITGRVPQFFRAPAGLRNPLLDPVLARTGLTLVSWSRRGYDAVHGNGESVLERMTRCLAAGDILVLHDGSPARSADGTPVVLSVLPALLERIAAAGLRPVTLTQAMQ